MAIKTLCAAGLLSVMASMAQPAPPAPPAPPQAAPAPPSRFKIMAQAARGTYLGVGVADVDANRASALKLKETRGAEVTMVQPDTPAAKAGIRVGDVILEYNGQPVQGTAELQRLVHETPAGRQVKIGLWRNGAPVTVDVTVEESKTYTYNWPFGDRIFRDPTPLNMPSMPRMPSIDIPRMVTAYQSSALGVECEQLAANSQLAEFFGVKDGLLVRSVRRNSAAEKAGIKAGDVIVKLGDTHIANFRDLAEALRNNRTTATVPATVVRNKHEVALTLTLENSGPAERF